MSNRSTSSVLSTGIGIGIAAVQLFDIAIHAATDQLEPLRIASNLIILLWLALAVSGRISARFAPVAVGSVGAYLLLNGIFLALEGVTNPAQGGAVRVALFALVFLTVLLSAWLTALYRRNLQR